MGRNWEEGEREGEARKDAREYCLKYVEWVDLIHEYEVREMLRELVDEGKLSQVMEGERDAAVGRWVSRNWEDFLPKGDPMEEFDYEENRT